MGYRNIDNGFIAHKRKLDGERQSLETHLLEVGQIAGSLAKKIGLDRVGELLGLLHDLGKYSQEFQTYLKSAVAPLAGAWIETWICNRFAKHYL